MDKAKSLNDIAWEKLFDKYNIISEIESKGSFQISASQIKEYREPRLMAKFDHTINLPELFVKNKLSILPISRGDYLISHFDAYHKFEKPSGEIVKVSLPQHIQSLNYNNITSEAVALNCAVATGIIEDFTGDLNIIPTVSGRMSSGSFNFKIIDVLSDSYRNISVSNSQIEIDAAYEGIKYLSLFEAKRDLSDDFLVRQLYYPYRTWQNQISKEIRPIFLVYSNGIYHLYQYIFENPNDYSSIELIKQKNYTIEDTSITTEDIQNIIKEIEPIEQSQVTFPQADRFERVINLCELLHHHSMSRDEVTEKYAFDVRQTNYYTDAARYLDLVEKDKKNGVPFYKLTIKGETLFKKGYKQRQLDYCTAILENKVFYETIKKYFETGVLPTHGYIIQIMKQVNMGKIESESTFKRRASTVRGWIEWIVGLINE